jgi:hypothetical protein
MLLFAEGVEGAAEGVLHDVPPRIPEGADYQVRPEGRQARGDVRHGDGPRRHGRGALTCVIRGRGPFAGRGGVSALAGQAVTRAPGALRHRLVAAARQQDQGGLGGALPHGEDFGVSVGEELPVLEAGVVGSDRAFRAEHGATHGGGRDRGAGTGRVVPVEHEQVGGPALVQDGEWALTGAAVVLGELDEVRAASGLDRRGDGDRDGARPDEAPPVAPRHGEGGDRGDGEHALRQAYRHKHV